ncbi:Mor transcription activator family protein [Polaromonas naphthalenivorans]|nr:Mor transcription activator family protein [Polaromonas naphthalenivorans]
MTTTKYKALTAGQAEDAAVQLQHDFVEIVREEIGMNEALASVFASAVVRGLRRRMGGSDLYIPAPDLSDRDASIRREFDGKNLAHIMAKYNVKRTRVYEICARRDPKDAQLVPSV